MAANGLGFLGLAVAAVCAAGASPYGSQTFVADLSADAKQEDFSNDVLLKCFGSSHASTALRADWQRQLAEVRQDIGTEYVRFHGLLDDDMSVVLKYKRIRSEADTCEFVEHQDYQDAAYGPAVDAASKEECCKACYASSGPNPCIAAVWTDDGKCYTKVNNAEPVSKPSRNITACVTSRRSPGKYTYSFVNIFSVFDFIRSIGMRPVVELSFMPELMASDPNNTGFHYKGGHSPPTDWGEWRDLIQALSSALIDRYGLDEVKQWYFEVWNEPNCGFYYTSGCCGPTCGNQTAYMELYVNTFQAVKAASKELRVGGPATAQLGWLGFFVDSAVSANCPPDFVSSHLYPTDPFINQTRDGFSIAMVNAADEVKAAAAKSSIPPPPILITEFNCGLGIDCADAPYAASFLAHQALNAQKIKESMVFQSYWTFSDIFEEQGQIPSEFSQAFGARSINGIAKPAYRAMQLIRRLKARAAPVQQMEAPPAANQSIDVIVTREGGQVEALISNHPGGPKEQGGQRVNDINDAQSNGRWTPGENDVINVTVRFTGAAVPEQVEIRRIDSDNTNTRAAWAAMGSPPYPTQKQLSQLRDASQVVVERVKPKAVTFVGAQEWEMTLQMLTYSVASVAFNTSTGA